MSYVALERVEIDGRLHRPGSSVELDPTRAAGLVAQGVLAVQDDPAPTVADATVDLAESTEALAAPRPRKAKA